MRFTLKAPSGRSLSVIYAVISIAVIVAIPLIYSDLYESILYKVFNRAFVSADVVAISPSYVSGVIKKIYVKEGDVVKKGQMIVLMDDTMYKADLDRSISRLKAMKARLDQLKGHAEERGEYLELKNELKVLEQDVRIAKLMLSYTRIISPIDGVVAQVMLRAGDVVKPGETVLYLYNPSTLYVRLYVSPENAFLFRVGMHVTVETPGGRLKGVVERVGGVEVFRVCGGSQDEIPVRIGVKNHSNLVFGQPVRVVVR